MTYPGTQRVTRPVRITSPIGSHDEYLLSTQRCTQYNSDAFCTCISTPFTFCTDLFSGPPLHTHTRQIDRQTDRQTDRHTDRQTDRQTYRQTDRQTHTHTHTHTHRLCLNRNLCLSTLTYSKFAAGCAILSNTAHRNIRFQISAPLSIWSWTGAGRDDFQLKASDGENPQALSLLDPQTNPLIFTLESALSTKHATSLLCNPHSRCS